MKKGTILVLAALVLAVLLLVVNKRMRSVGPVKRGYPPVSGMPDFVPVDWDLTQTPTVKEEIFDLGIDVAQFGIEE